MKITITITENADKKLDVVLDHTETKKTTAKERSTGIVINNGINELLKELVNADSQLKD